MKIHINFRKGYATKLLLVLFCFSLYLIGCKKDSITLDAPSEQVKDNPNVLSKLELQTLFNEKKPIDWSKERDAKYIYSIGMQTDKIFAIGYKPLGTGDISDIMHTIDISTSEWKGVEDKLKNVITNSEDKKIEEILIKEAHITPAFVVKISSFSTIKKLIELPEIRYVEPLNHSLFAFDYSRAALRDDEVSFDLSDPHIDFLYGFGLTCGCASGEVNSLDYTNIDPGVKMPWHFTCHTINEDAWEISAGEGIGVAVIDSGVSNNQENLDNYQDFDPDNIYSSGREEERKNFLPYAMIENPIANLIIKALPDPTKLRYEGPPYSTTDSPHDRCGHGTKAAGLIAAPRGYDGNALGIAYGCDLFNYRACHDPLINISDECMAVKDALIETTLDVRIKVINMSIGMIPGESCGFIEDGINLVDGLEKLMICAAGTSANPGTIYIPTFPQGSPPIAVDLYEPDNVVFPANHEKTIAVTGIKDPGISTEMEPCFTCHYGEEMDYVSVMARPNDNGRKGVALGCDTDEPYYFGGSSAGAAHFSGIVALIWSKLGLNATKDVVLQKIDENVSHSGGYVYPPGSSTTPTLGKGFVSSVQAALEN